MSRRSPGLRDDGTEGSDGSGRPIGRRRNGSLLSSQRITPDLFCSLGSTCTQSTWRVRHTLPPGGRQPPHRNNNSLCERVRIITFSSHMKTSLLPLKWLHTLWVLNNLELSLSLSLSLSVSPHMSSSFVTFPSFSPSRARASNAVWSWLLIGWFSLTLNPASKPSESGECVCVCVCVCVNMWVCVHRFPQRRSGGGKGWREREREMMKKETLCKRSCCASSSLD